MSVLLHMPEDLAVDLMLESCAERPHSLILSTFRHLRAAQIAFTHVNRFQHEVVPRPLVDSHGVASHGHQGYSC